MNRPKQVVTAIYLLYISLVIGLVSGLINIFSGNIEATVAAQGGAAQATPGRISQVIMLVIILVIMWLIYFCISKRQNWARILFLVLYVLGAVAWVFSLKQMAATSVLMLILSCINMALGLMALILLFTPNGNQWFRRVKNSE